MYQWTERQHTRMLLPMLMEVGRIAEGDWGGSLIVIIVVYLRGSCTGKGGSCWFLTGVWGHARTGWPASWSPTRRPACSLWCPGRRWILPCGAAVWTMRHGRTGQMVPWKYIHWMNCRKMSEYILWSHGKELHICTIEVARTQEGWSVTVVQTMFPCNFHTITSLHKRFFVLCYITHYYITHSQLIYFNCT